MGIAFVDLSALEWDEDEGGKATVVHTPAFSYVEREASVEVELPDWDPSVEIDLLFLEPDLA